jgi:hypothetical protein
MRNQAIILFELVKDLVEEGILCLSILFPKTGGEKKVVSRSMRNPKVAFRLLSIF